MFEWFGRYIRRNGCKWCGRRITMVEVEIGKWLAFENGIVHDCPMRPDRFARYARPAGYDRPRPRSRDWGSYVSRRGTSGMGARDVVRVIAFCVAAVVLLMIVFRVH